MTYTVSIQKSAQKALGRISTRDQNRIIDAIRSLAQTPRPAGSKKLSGRDGWRIRIGDYRVIYGIQDQQLIILVVAIGHRKEIYR
ncbi:MAG: type II toxin-antitoxin system RelE/ParE family toxin [Blastocatellia bacterium]|nr:type II toxin-antitoxin system RelE/ParE family toxin [Blastocatellia bacterium]